jgi:hypothetical protein
MYYEEKRIDGVIHSRTTPNGEFVPLSYEALTGKVNELSNCIPEFFPKGFESFCETFYEISVIIEEQKRFLEEEDLPEPMKEAYGNGGHDGIIGLCKMYAKEFESRYRYAAFYDELLVGAVSGFVREKLHPRKTWNYKVNFSASFDYGSVEARTCEEAKKLAQLAAEYDEKRINKILGKKASVELDYTNGIEIEEERYGN